MITQNEIGLVRFCIDTAKAKGASASRISLSKSALDSYTFFNGELEKVTHSADRAIYIHVFADGRYGGFSTNRLERNELEDFIGKAVAMVKMLGEDPCRGLPAPERQEKGALTGRELDLYDETYHDSTSDKRLGKAAGLSIIGSLKDTEGYRIISEECEYSESVDDTYIADSQGFEGRHTETMYYCFTEMTIESDEGCKYSGHWWEAAQKEADLKSDSCARKALEKATAQIGPKKRRSGKYRMVLSNQVASRMVAPIISALNASSIQQKMSFMEDTAGKKVFSDGFTLKDLARTSGKNGSRLFDSEGVATKDTTVIGNGVVNMYFVNTYMSRKTGMSPTVEDISRPCVMPYVKGSDMNFEEKEVSLEDILKMCSSGIYVTGFNGGNCNPATGDFSFGIEGFAFSKGKITHPVREMLITGNIISLWNSLIAAGTDIRSSARWQVPTLAFEDVSFSA